MVFPFVGFAYVLHYKHSVEARNLTVAQLRRLSSKSAMKNGEKFSPPCKRCERLRLRDCIYHPEVGMRNSLTWDDKKSARHTTFYTSIRFSTVRGISRTKRVPIPSRLSTRIFPLCASTTPFTTVSPRPHPDCVPSSARVALLKF